MTETTDFWKGPFGDSYTKRNRVDWRARIPFWSHIHDVTGARSVWELGCNAGWNLSAIRRAYPDVFVRGTEINESAALLAQIAGLELVVSDNSQPLFPAFELTFTAGVLIHIPPDNLASTMQQLIDLSSDYVLAVEYEAEEETEVEYRGHTGKLWKRHYGKLYEEMGLELVDTGIAEGFDNCTYWLLRKP